MFYGLDSLKAVFLNDNPGSPFPVPLAIKRTDARSASIAVPATIEVSLPFPATHDLDIKLTIRNANHGVYTTAVIKKGTYRDTIEFDSFDTVTAEWGYGGKGSEPPYAAYIRSVNGRANSDENSRLDGTFNISKRIAESSLEDHGAGYYGVTFVANTLCFYDGECGFLGERPSYAGSRGNIGGSSGSSGGSSNQGSPGNNTGTPPPPPPPPPPPLRSAQNGITLNIPNARLEEQGDFNRVTVNGYEIDNENRIEFDLVFAPAHHTYRVDIELGAPGTTARHWENPDLTVASVDPNAPPRGLGYFYADPDTRYDWAGPKQLFGNNGQPYMISAYDDPGSEIRLSGYVFTVNDNTAEGDRRIVVKVTFTPIVYDDDTNGDGLVYAGDISGRDYVKYNYSPPETAGTAHPIKSLTNFRGWNKDHTYSAGDLVEQDWKLWRCISDVPLTGDTTKPEIYPTGWEEVGLDTPSILSDQSFSLTDILTLVDDDESDAPAPPVIVGNLTGGLLPNFAPFHLGSHNTNSGRDFNNLYFPNVVKESHAGKLYQGSHGIYGMFFRLDRDHGAWSADYLEKDVAKNPLYGAQAVLTVRGNGIRFRDTANGNALVSQITLDVTGPDSIRTAVKVYYDPTNPTAEKIEDAGSPHIDYPVDISITNDALAGRSWRSKSVLRIYQDVSDLDHVNVATARATSNASDVSEGNTSIVEGETKIFSVKIQGKSDFAEDVSGTLELFSVEGISTESDFVQISKPVTVDKDSSNATIIDVEITATADNIVDDDNMINLDFVYDGRGIGRNVIMVMNANARKYVLNPEKMLEAVLKLL